MKLKTIIFLLSFFSILSFAGSDFDQSHTPWTNILSTVVIPEGKTTVIDYLYLKRNPEKLLNYLSSLEKISKQNFLVFTENQKLAFWINAYNAYTIKLILDNYPVKSIKDIGSIFSSPWKKKFIHLLNDEISLDYIEHEQIRKNFKEPRIHFAVVCASIGCPSLSNEAYIAEKLDSQLEDATIKFLKDTKRNRFNKEAKTLEISSIFKWYEEDFQKYSGGIKAFISKKITSSQTDQLSIIGNETKVIFLEYDWALNIK